MKIAVFSRIRDPKIEQICDIMDKNGVEYRINPADVSEFDLALSFGGDGTFLNTAWKVRSKKIPILGVNAGHLGFLASVAISDFQKTLSKLIRGKYTVHRLSMLQVDGMGDALNEFTLQKNGNSMLDIELSIDDYTVTTYRADGLIVSTPTGSTAYSMSVGGSIIAPSCHCFIISPIAPHNLSVRPLVVADTSKIKLTIHSRGENFARATLDNRQENVRICLDSEFKISKCPEYTQVILPEGSSFYKALSEKLNWGRPLVNYDE